MEKLIKDMNKRKQDLWKEIELIDTIVKYLQGYCNHESVSELYDSHGKYRKCDICGQILD